MLQQDLRLICLTVLASTLVSACATMRANRHSHWDDYDVGYTLPATRTGCIDDAPNCNY